jgi:hypothetical protein
VNSTVLLAVLLTSLPIAATVATAADGNPEPRKDVLVIEEVPPAEDVDAPTRDVTREVPVRGMSMANVRNAFGEPQEEHPAVGEPPITRWDYDGYSVFFEFDKVLHSVVTE